MTRPALEMLFARAAQGRVFLLLTVGGMALGLLAAVGGWLHGRSRLLGAAADVLCALLGAGMLLGGMLLAGDGLRLYALLGLLLGALLFRAGVLPVAAAIVRGGRKLFCRRQE